MINCLVIDDEPFARKVIMEFCSHMPNLLVVGACGNALEARNVLQQQPVDIIFLDINMPVLDGMAFLKTLERKPAIIFTTAYKEYAAEAFDINACDYLVKPFSLERFIVAVDKAVNALTHKPKVAATPAPAGTEKEYTFLKADGKIYKLVYSEVLFAEAKGNYTRIVTTEGVMMPKMALSNFEEQLPVQSFIRVHRSFVINKARITHIEGNTVFLHKTEIPIGSNYKELFLKFLEL